MEIIVLIVIIIVGIFLKGIPELKKSLGSSDKFITKKNYNPIIVQGVENEIWLENLEEEYKDYSSPASKVATNLSYSIEKVMTKCINETVSIFKKLFT